LNGRRGIEIGLEILQYLDVAPTEKKTDNVEKKKRGKRFLSSFLHSLSLSQFGALEGNLEDFTPGGVASFANGAFDSSASLVLPRSQSIDSMLQQHQHHQQQQQQTAAPSVPEFLLQSSEFRDFGASPDVEGMRMSSSSFVTSAASFSLRRGDSVEFFSLKQSQQSIQPLNQSTLLTNGNVGQ
jgi:hypothetical protein